MITPTKDDFKEYLPSVLFLVCVNLFPLYGVFVLDWDVFPLMLLFWMENVVIGVLNIPKMIFASGSKSIFQKILMVPFFIVHYGIFTTGHGALLVEFFGNRYFPTDFSVAIENTIQIIDDLYLGIPLLALTASHSYSFFYNYIGKGEYKIAHLDRVMFQPYGRIVILHVTILVGGILVVALNEPKMGIVMLVGLKLLLDLGSHIRERKKFKFITVSDENLNAEGTMN